MWFAKPDLKYHITINWTVKLQNVDLRTSTNTGHSIKFNDAVSDRWDVLARTMCNNNLVGTIGYLK